MRFLIIPSLFRILNSQAVSVETLSSPSSTRYPNPSHMRSTLRDSNFLIYSHPITIYPRTILYLGLMGDIRRQLSFMGMLIFTNIAP